MYLTRDISNIVKKYINYSYDNLMKIYNNRKFYKLKKMFHLKIYLLYVVDWVMLDFLFHSITLK